MAAHQRSSTCPSEDGRIEIIAHQRSADRLLNLLKGSPLFTCTLASTATAQIDGISAAGATPEMRRYTAALDGEALVQGRPLSLNEIPRSPEGPPSPVVISCAALRLLNLEPMVVDAGTEIPPLAPRLALGGQPGRCISGGSALSLTPEFIENSSRTGRVLAQQAPWLVLSESVPGGTTTALALLEGLGFSARGRVSSSMPGGNHHLKEQLVGRALEAAALSSDCSALDVAAAVGDPMQPAVALMALEASRTTPVILGGGTQMAAVAALIQRLYEEGHAGNLANIGLATTAWVSRDSSADLAAILNQLPFPMAAFAACLDFSRSSLHQLQRYEEGLVKEGVGAGAAAFAAFVSGDISHDRLLEEIEAVTLSLGAG